MEFLTEEIKKMIMDYKKARPGIPAGWVYLGDDKVRYLLGQPVDPKQESEQKNLLVIGVNPSTAKPGEPDPTIKRVIGITQEQGYDGWIMVNIYPQRATNPKNMTYIPEIIENNLEVIRFICQAFNIKDVWCVWGNLIDNFSQKKSFLKDSQEKVKDQLKKMKCYHYSTLTKKGNPPHPLYVPYGDKFYDFPI